MYFSHAIIVNVGHGTFFGVWARNLTFEQFNFLLWLYFGVLLASVTLLTWMYGRFAFQMCEANGSEIEHLCSFSLPNSRGAQNVECMCVTGRDRTS